MNKSQKYKQLFTNPRWVSMFVLVAVMLVFAKLLRPALGALIEKIPSVGTYDFVLDLLPIVQGQWIIFIYIYVLIASVLFFAITKLYYNPVDVPYAGLVFVLAMLLTDIMFTATIFGPPNGFIQSWFMFGYSKDLFPSMHVGAPLICFLLADRRWVRVVMLGITILMSVVVLLMHIHYTIDVIGAIFIFFGFWCLCDRYLKKFMRRSYFVR